MPNNAKKEAPYKLDKRSLHDIRAIALRAKGRPLSVNSEILESDPTQGIGDPNAAAELLRHFCNSVATGKKVHPVVMQYLAEGFREFLDSKRPNIAKALGLERQRAGNPGAISQRRRQLTPDARTELTEMVNDMKLKGHSDGVVKKQLSKLFATSEDTVRALIRERRNGGSK